MLDFVQQSSQPHMPTNIVTSAIAHILTNVVLNSEVALATTYQSLATSVDFQLPWHALHGNSSCSQQRDYTSGLPGNDAIYTQCVTSLALLSLPRGLSGKSNWLIFTRLCHWNLDAFL